MKVFRERGGRKIGRKMLVVDDQKGIRKLLEELFHKEGFDVAVAADGKEAIEVVNNWGPDIIVMDMKMPNMNGLEASEEILRIKKDIPIIIMTAYGEMEVVTRALEIGVKKYITKPFDIVVLRDMVRDIMG